ncbi:MAG: diadenosine tetraphosphate hydrolase [Proteobacteria bacterium]|nr:MAG: diadenosine tetraphosphate hydrolase [Pseudomonadota bacterium]
MSCKVASGEIVPTGGELKRNPHFNVSHDVKYMIPGFLIVASNRHFKRLDEMTGEESVEFISLTIEARRALGDALDIMEVFYFYNEDTRHHFHLWIIPKLEWMERFGRSLECLAPALKWAEENLIGEDARKAVAEASARIQGAW